MVVREHDGVLRFATPEERDRALHVYFPRPSKMYAMPQMFNEDQLEVSHTSVFLLTLKLYHILCLVWQLSWYATVLHWVSCPQTIGLAPQMWHETLTDFTHQCTTGAKRSVLWPSEYATVHFWTTHTGGAHSASRSPVGWGEDTPPYTPPHSVLDFQGQCPPIFFSWTVPGKRVNYFLVIDVNVTGVYCV